MNDYRYILEPYKGLKNRYRCPGCNKAGKFTRYIDKQNGEQLGENVGKCERVIKCGYHYPPKHYFVDNNISFTQPNEPKVNPRIILHPKFETSFIETTLLQQSRCNKHPNFFIDYLASLWDYEVAYYLADKYNIGTSKHWQGANIFWQMDCFNRIRSGKIMLYNSCTGKRVKNPYNHINWVHTVLRLQNFKLEQCYFGEHLLNTEPTKPVAIVESEKTAIIASVFLPEFIWLACGSVNNLNENKSKGLKGRNVVLFPDLGCYELWKQKIPKLTKLATFRISNLLERKATEEERRQGLDLVDFLIKLPYK